MSAFRLRYYLVKLKMLEMGAKAAADLLDEWVNPASLFDELADSKAADLEAHLKLHEDRYAAYTSRSHRRPVDLGTKNLQRTVLDEFRKKCLEVKKCENCGAFSPPYRKDGYSKIFQKPLSNAMKKRMSAMRLKLKVGVFHVSCLYFE